QEIPGVLPVILGEPSLDVRDLLGSQAIEQLSDFPRTGADRLQDLRLDRIVTPNKVLLRESPREPGVRLVDEPDVLRQRTRPVPGQERVDVPIEVVALGFVDVQVLRELPTQVDVGVVVGEAHRAAARDRQQQADQERTVRGYQNVSTVMWPGARRRCLRKPRSPSAAVASFTMSGLPHSMNCERSGANGPAAASSRPSRIAAGIRPGSDPACGSRLTNVTEVERYPRAWRAARNKWPGTTHAPARA